MLKKFLTAAAALLGLAGCAGPTPQIYAGGTPALDLSQFFNGKVEAWGMVQERDGKVIRRMHVEMNCTWDGDTGTFDETFTYDDGSTEKRIWTLHRNGSRYTGTAADVVGEAHGETVGYAFNWRYVLAYKGESGIVKLDMDDWMWLIDEHTVANRTRFSKFGINFGEVTLFFRKVQ